MDAQLEHLGEADTVPADNAEAEARKTLATAKAAINTAEEACQKVDDLLRNYLADR